MTNERTAGAKHQRILVLTDPRRRPLSGHDRGRKSRRSALFATGCAGGRQPWLLRRADPNRQKLRGFLAGRGRTRPPHQTSALSGRRAPWVAAPEPCRADGRHAGSPFGGTPVNQRGDRWRSRREQRRWDLPQSRRALSGHPRVSGGLFPPAERRKGRFSGRLFTA
ncbi:hypothetical protein D3C80_1083960 [compost metagenome]